MSKKILIFIISAAVGVLLFSGSAKAVGTSAGQIITAEGSENFIDYSDIAGNPKATVYGPTFETEVKSIYGFAFVDPVDDDKTTDPNVVVYYQYDLTNSGNTSDSYSLSYHVDYTGDYGSDWEIVFYLDADDNEIPDGGPITSIDLAEDGVTHFLLAVTPEATAGSGALATVIVTAETSSDPAGQYTGANGNSYGGLALANDVTQTDVSAPTMTISRVSTSDAPSQYNQTNDVHNPIPGSVVTITMTYSNEGTSTAESAIIIDKVPSGHQAGHVDATSTDVANVTITAANGTALGWEVYYTTEASLASGRRAFANKDGWVLLGTLEVSDPHWDKDSTPALPLTATFIKWEKPEVGPEDDGKTITWGYIVR